MEKNILAGYCIDDKVSEMNIDDARKLTHLNIASGTIRNGEPILVSEKGVKCIEQLKKWNPELKCSVSFGGEFSAPCMTEDGRKKLADGLCGIIKKYNLDGVDIDWEYPCCGENGFEANPADRVNYTLILKEIREQLNSTLGEHLLLTSAVGAGQYFIDSTQMDKAQEYLDYVYIMTYDIRGAFQVLTGHHTNLYTATGDLNRMSADAAVHLFLKAGVPKEKIVIGAAMYSRMWNNVENRNNGFLQLTKSSGGYGPVYHELKQNYINKNGFKRFWDDEAKAPYLFNGNTFISYDDEESLKHKCGYIKENDLAGIFYWEHGGDQTGELLKSMYLNLNKD